MNQRDGAPRLAAPGAGIPVIERVVGGIVLSLRRRRYVRERVSAAFGRERGLIARLYRAAAPESLHGRVLIPRLRGLEDSSRYWSVLMTLDHLRIVNAQITRVIGDLVRGDVPAEAASTAAVKPSDRVGPEVVGAYEESCDRLIDGAASAGDLRTPAHYSHPWFGPLDAAGWHVMAAMHMGIHRAQIARIGEYVRRSM